MRLINREKVIKGLECCSFAWNIQEPPNCRNCPYTDEDFGTCQIPNTTLIDDALELLKKDQIELAELQATLDLANGKLINMGYEIYNCDDGRDALKNTIKAIQEPRVLTIDEFDQALDTVIWYDSRDSENLSTSYVLLTGYSLKHSFAEFKLIGGTEVTGTLYRYNKDWRLWSSRPTDEQREATPWVE